MVADMPALEREFMVVTRLYTIAKEFDVPVEPEDFALYQTLAPSFQHLKVRLFSPWTSDIAAIEHEARLHF